jgi:hypothetical protein
MQKEWEFFQLINEKLFKRNSTGISLYEKNTEVNFESCFDNVVQRRFKADS